nr:helix-turn-helix domain-containing protein [Cellulosimicrobium sp. SH8]
MPHIKMGHLVRYSQEGLDRFIQQNIVECHLLVAEERERRRRRDGILDPRRQPKRQPPRSGPYLSTQEVAAHLRVTRVIVAQWLAIGLLPGYKAGSKWRVSKADLDEWDELIRWLDDAPTGTRRTILLRTTIEREIADRLGYVRSVGALRRSGVNVSVWVPRPAPRGPR